ncbi:hypothetical protein LTR99_004781 [Exophiala xenobiotica]|uniref:BCD1 alpha/beta domain-containing protein n=1 Tax=Vermiconidia calcicola TaxID=1690605 RepID=A0AAV9QCQ3_9PEZI|nr:hypothetical protein LTR72_004297 [Exophiala xenobiotica]KAK5540062.1 hypothetical protein LTR25_003767 [Vermiconidia calcicola]KAK5543152.1 hypothetical protein LTR23_004915 [Chaetothyriales sp. CCFEE 6169]KAK5274511.1 hypothetical protein LTR96_001112 [Exophiala xenobiotica]KAK5293599.1 hypothetical protein LTR14_004490 [Exophiala xenobiotica]
MNFFRRDCRNVKTRLNATLPPPQDADKWRRWTANRSLCDLRHKSWAQCSGIRNPAAYRKRADLATSASIDQDFNFITSVERTLQKADELVLDKGLDLAPAGLRPNAPESKRKFALEVEQRGIRLIKAPKGLSRSKENTSRWDGRQHKCIMWTTEWMFHDGTKKIHNVRESRTVAQAFLDVFGRRALGRKRKWSSAETTTAPALLPDTVTIQPSSVEGEEPMQDVPVAEEEAVDDLPAAEEDGATQKTAEDDTVAVQEAIMADNASDKTQRKPQGEDVSKVLQDLHFYLLRPNTTAKLKCLVPISQASTLKEVVSNKTLLEFPTFYVRREPPEALSEPFVTEEKYEQLYGSEIPINLPTFAADTKQDEQEQKSLAQIDEQKVLEVLHKDLTG